MTMNLNGKPGPAVRWLFVDPIWPYVEDIFGDGRASSSRLDGYDSPDRGRQRAWALISLLVLSAL